MVNGPLVPFDAKKPTVARLHDYAFTMGGNYHKDLEILNEGSG